MVYSGRGKQRLLTLEAGTAFMGAGSLDPGIPLDLAATPDAEQLDPRLKYDTSGKKPIVLIPQPSDDPNDPLVLQQHTSARRNGRC